jgi:hypothetical protein
MATQKEKLAVYELIGLICSWSYAHRCGNGELSDKEQQAIIDRALQRLKEFK